MLDMRWFFAVLVLGLGLTVSGAGQPARAACSILGFEVNDYGKEGPTRDAKKLLDAHIVSWAKKHDIKSYRKGKKSVSCYLFLDFGFFDEWTCKATSTVCYRGKKKLD
ncbi:MAG: hypothetical protein ACR2O4_09165 [Hyphomicrobiaceae bacterium]